MGRDRDLLETAREAVSWSADHTHDADYRYRRSVASADQETASRAVRAISVSPHEVVNRTVSQLRYTPVCSAQEMRPTAVVR